MKKLVLTIVALVAMATTSFAQYNDVFNKILSSSSYSSSSFNAPPSRTINLNSINLNTINVDSYYRSNGTFVENHVRTTPNNTNWDNFSTKYNSNPYTGSTGYRARDYSIDAYNYGAGHTIHTGSRGGQFYYNSNGNKTYVPKRSSLW